MQWVLLATGSLSLASAGIYGYVGQRLYRRPVSEGARLAARLFAVWWLGLCATSLLGAGQIVLAALGALGLPAAETISLLGTLVDCLFLWALVEFLTYVYTGRYALGWIGGLYALFTFAAVYYFYLGHPYAIVVRAGSPTLLTVPVSSRALVAVVDIGLVFPELVGGLLYLTLLRRVRDRTQRYRIAAVGTAVLAWFGIVFFFPAPTLALDLVRGLLLLVPPLLALVAYQPPEWLRHRLRVTGLEWPLPADTSPEAG